MDSGSDSENELLLVPTDGSSAVSVNGPKQGKIQGKPFYKLNLYEIFSKELKRHLAKKFKFPLYEPNEHADGLF